MANPSLFPQKQHWAWLAVGLFILFLFCLGARGLNEPDEGRYANIARAMVLSGDWWEPRMSGFGHYDKPPLVYWLTAASLQMFGMNEWAARLPPFLGAIFSLAGLAWAGYRLRGPRIAWWAVLICGTSVQFYVLGRILSPDMLLTGWCTLAIAAWAECRHCGGAWRWWFVSLAFWTLAWWTKATPALIPLAGVLIGVLMTRDVPGRKALRIWLLFPAIIVLGAAWFLSLMSHYPELQQFFFGRELAGRVAGHADGRRGSKLYYLGVSAIAWLPWWPWAAWVAWKQRANTTFKTAFAKLALEWWIVLIGLIIFSLAASKLPTYTLILAPWAALGMAALIFRPREPSGPEPAGFPVPAALIAGVFAVTVSTCALLVPHFETRLGVNSSIRQVCDYLRSQGATRVQADQYWPGMEFYLGDDAIRYVVNSKRQRERSTDAGLPPARFIDPDLWSISEFGQVAVGKDFWLVRFLKRKKSPFDAVANPKSHPSMAKAIGQFALIHVQADENGALTVLPPNP